MKENKILTCLKEALNELLLSFSTKKIDVTEVLRILNETVHYNSSYQPYIYEMFFIQALELNKIPKESILINMMFNCIHDTEDYLLPENYNQAGTRMKILKKLKLDKSIELYEFFLIRNHRESRINFKKEVDNPEYIETNKIKVTFEIIRESITEELKNK